MDCLVNRFDHFEVATNNLPRMQGLFEIFGFRPVQFFENHEQKSHLLTQGQCRVLITEGKLGSHAHTYVQKHGDGVCSIAYHTPHIESTLDTALKRGASLVSKIHSEKYEGSENSIERKTAAIKSVGDVLATFVERSVKPFDVSQPFGRDFKFFNSGTRLPEASAIGLISVDHLTNNVGMGEMAALSEFYQRVFGWVEARYFDIKGAATGLVSKVMQSPDGAVKIPLNEAKEEKSQIQEFISMHRGPGVQHIAFNTADIRKTVRALGSQGIKFLDIDSEYYKEVPTRLNNVTEPLGELEQLQILVDGDAKGYLLQIFTENQIGPMFFEIIQRKGHNGFGEGNFTALFRSIERDQERRGVL